VLSTRAHNPDSCRVFEGDGTEHIILHSRSDAYRLVSIHVYDGEVFPRTGNESHGQVILNIHARQLTRAFFREAGLQALEAIDQWRPQLILISAGYDGFVNDPLMGCERGFAQLLKEDYYGICKELQAKADEFCEGRLLAVMEGGYCCGSADKRPVIQIGEWVSPAPNESIMHCIVASCRALVDEPL
jgi:acetoin utilization deacetylase AcuC-like enzyme